MKIVLATLVLVVAALLGLVALATFNLHVFVAAHRIALSPWVSGSLVAFGPAAIYAQAGYAEPLYFVWT